MEIIGVSVGETVRGQPRVLLRTSGGVEVLPIKLARWLADQLNAAADLVEGEEEGKHDAARI